MMLEGGSGEPGASLWVHPIAGAIRTEVVADFEPQDDAEAGQLSLKVGEIVYVLDRHESSWWGGHKEGDDLTGWFPSSAVQPTDDQLTGDLDCEPLGGNSSKVKQLRDELGAKDGRISELEEKVKSLEALLVKSLPPPNADGDTARVPQQSLSRRLFERESSAASVAPISAAPVTNQRSSPRSSPKSSPRSSASQPPKPSLAASQGQPPRPRNDSARRANTPKQIAAPWRARDESTSRPLAVRALVSEFERRSTSHTPSATRHMDPSPRFRCGPPPSSRTASVTRTAVAAPVALPAAAVSDQVENAPPRGRPVVAKVHEEERDGRGCGAEERSNTPVIFGMSPIARSERTGLARSLASPARGLTVQDRIRQLYGGA